MGLGVVGLVAGRTLTGVSPTGLLDVVLFGFSVLITGFGVGAAIDSGFLDEIWVFGIGGTIGTGATVLEVVGLVAGTPVAGLLVPEMLVGLSMGAA